MPTEVTAGVHLPWAEWADRRPAFAGIHLDTAAAGRTSYAVQRAVAEHLRRESEVGAYVAEADATPVLDGGREELGRLLGVPGRGVVFVESATAALQALLSAWPLPERATVAVAPSEWGTNLRAFRVRGMAVQLLDVHDDGRVDVAALRDMLAVRPPSVVHVVTAAPHRGLVQPVAEIVTACHAAGVPVWVDAAQALGQVDAASDADAVYATSRKWLCGPRGVGVLGVAPRWWERLQVEPWALQPERHVVARLESDEANVAGRVGLCVAVQEYLTSGPAAVQRRLEQVAQLARDALGDVPGWTLVPGAPGSGAIVALRPDAGQDVVDVRRRLRDDCAILVTASSPARAPHDRLGPTLRVSPHVDAAAEHIDALHSALRGFR